MALASSEVRVAEAAGVFSGVTASLPQAATIVNAATAMAALAIGATLWRFINIKNVEPGEVSQVNVAVPAGRRFRGTHITKNVGLPEISHLRRYSASNSHLVGLPCSPGDSIMPKATRGRRA